MLPRVIDTHFHCFIGFGFDEDPAWFDWFHKYRNSMADKTLETELIPRLKDQGVVTKLGMVTALKGSVLLLFILMVFCDFPGFEFHLLFVVVLIS